MYTQGEKTYTIRVRHCNTFALWLRDQAHEISENIDDLNYIINQLNLMDQL